MNNSSYFQGRKEFLSNILGILTAKLQSLSNEDGGTDWSDKKNAEAGEAMAE